MVDLNFQIKGAGKPIVLLHGFPFDHSIWGAVTELLSEKLRVIVPDLRGHGLSPVPEPPYTLGSMAEDIAGLMDALSIPSAIVAGHSMGGYLCMEFARSHSERLCGLGLIATTAAADSPEKRKLRLEGAAEAQKTGVQPLVDQMIPQLTENEKLRMDLRKLMLKIPPKGVMGAQTAMAQRPDSIADLAQVEVPSLVIAGRCDQIVTLEAAERMAGQLRNGKLVLVPNAGHMPMLENPLMVANALLELAERVYG